MDAGDQHLLIVGPVEDADPATFRQIAGGAPEKIVLQFGSAGMFEAEYLATLRVDPDITCLMAPSFPAASIA